MATQNLYDNDFYAWTQHQAKLLYNQQWDQIDLPNLIEEIESLGRQERQELRNRLTVLLCHLLKWHFQPQKRSRSWLATIRIQRLEIADLLADSPSLKTYLEGALQRGYCTGREKAAGETNLPSQTFPADCPYSLTEVLDNQFYPGEPSELVPHSHGK
jgi:hypothetical protein